MNQEKLIKAWRALAPTPKHLLELMAVIHEPINRTLLVEASAVSGFFEHGKKLVYKTAKPDVEKLIKSGLAEYCRGRSGPIVVAPAIVDLIAQEVLLQDLYQRYLEAGRKVEPNPNYQRREERKLRDQRAAFYLGDGQAFQKLKAGSLESLGVMSPFRADTFLKLRFGFQLVCLADSVFWGIVMARPSIGTEIYQHLELLVQSKVNEHSVRILLDWLSMKGDLAGIKKLDKMLPSAHSEVLGGLEFLKGNYDTALAHFETAIKEGRKRNDSRVNALGQLSSMLYGVLLLKSNSPAAQKKMSALLNECRGWQADYNAFVLPLLDALEAQLSNSNSVRIRPYNSTMPPLMIVSYGWIWRWMFSTQQPPFKQAVAEKAATDYRELGLLWLAAECEAIAACVAEFHDMEKNGEVSESDKSSKRKVLSGAATLSQRSAQTHQQLGTKSIVDLIKPTPAWEKTLLAIEALAGPSVKPGARAAEQPLNDERMIWELEFSISSSKICVSPYVQKFSKKGWTKGRKVGLSRLHEQHGTKEFAFLTDQDQAICRTLGAYAERNYYGYNETYYQWNESALARAIVGHPYLYRVGDRTSPLEVSVGEPTLVVETIGDQISVGISPTCIGQEIDFSQDASGHLTITEFTPRQQNLAKMLLGSGWFPADQQQRVAKLTASLSSIIPVHSDVQGEGTASQSVDADSRIYVQLTPFEDGLRAELSVRPLGEQGPSCRPGTGASNLLAAVEGRTISTNRNLDLETRGLAKLLSESNALDSQTVDVHQEQWLFPTGIDALDLVCELQSFAKAGDIVVLWPRGKTHDVAGSVTTAQLRVRVRQDNDWFAASGKLEVNKNLKLDMLELLELVADSPSRFVKLNDGRFVALSENLRRRITEIAAFGQTAKGKIRIDPIRALALEGFVADTDAKTDKHWDAHVGKIHQAAELSVVPPSTLQADLRDYQSTGFGWLKRLAHWSGGACLADDMGLGKTVQALALAIDRAPCGPTLVVAPASVGFNWESETRKFAPTLTPKIFGDTDRKEFFENLAPGDLAIVTYGLMQSEIKRFAKVEWGTVILDEAQAIKNMDTKRSQAAMQLKAGFRVIMTGTPLENHLGELWNLFRFITPGLLGAHKDFQQRFAVPIERDQCRSSRQQLKQLVQPFLLRRTKTEVLDELPSRTETQLEVELSPAEAALYDSVREQALQKLTAVADDSSKKGQQHLQILAEITRLRLLCCHPSLVGADEIAGSKLEMFEEKITEIVEGGHKVLVFSQFVKHLAILKSALDKLNISYQYLDGSTPTRQRKEKVESFQAGQGDVFLISLKAGGTGLNLTAADYVIHMDPWWNPAVEDQATDRAHRIGQTRPVNVYRLVTRGTIEEKIVALHRTKRDLADSLLEGSSIGAKLSAGELLNMLRG